MFIIGTGSLFPVIPPKKRYNGICKENAAALAHAIDTAKFNPFLNLIYKRICQTHPFSNYYVFDYYVKGGQKLKQFLLPVSTSFIHMS